MAVEPDDLLARAAAAARDEEPPAEWPAVARSVRDRVARSVTPSARILVAVDTGADGSRTWVSSRIVEDVVRRRLQAAPTHAPSRLSVEVDDDRLLAVRADLVVAYRADLQTLTAAVRRELLEVLDDLIGPDADRVVDLRVVDVVDGDPRRD